MDPDGSTLVYLCWVFIIVPALVNHYAMWKDENNKKTLQKIKGVARDEYNSKSFIERWLRILLAYILLPFANWSCIIFIFYEVDLEIQNEKAEKIRLTNPRLYKLFRR